jgi:hypothetical protein
MGKSIRREDIKTITGKKKKLSFLIISTLLIFGMLSLFILGSYWLEFGSCNISDFFSDWVDFSTYIYNFFSILLAMVNIGIVAYIATIANNFSQEQHTENIKLQEKYNIESRLHERKMKIAELIENIQKALMENNFICFSVAHASLTDFVIIFSIDGYEPFENVLEKICSKLEHQQDIEKTLMKSYVETKNDFISSFKYIIRNECIDRPPK